MTTTNRYVRDFTNAFTRDLPRLTLVECESAKVALRSARLGYLRADELAAAYRAFDTGFGGLSEAPSTSAGIPERWASVYDAEIERAYRREIRRAVARVEAHAD